MQGLFSFRPNLHSLQGAFKVCDARQWGFFLISIIYI
jgi:hypothetical protein